MTRSRLRTTKTEPPSEDVVLPEDDEFPEEESLPEAPEDEDPPDEEEPPSEDESEGPPPDEGFPEEHPARPHAARERKSIALTWRLRRLTMIDRMLRLLGLS